MQATTLVSTKNMPRDEWIAWRKQGIGGSEAAAVLGLHPFQSAISVWADKTGRAPERVENEAMWLGTILEEPVAKRIATENRITIQRRNAILQHPDYPWMIADIDYKLVGERAGIEIKTTSAFNKFDFDSGDVPPYYYVQCMHYMAVTGYPYWYLFVYVVGRKPYQFIIQRNEDEIAALIEQEKHFWEHYVQADIKPPTDGSDASREIIASLYPQAEIESVSLLDVDGDCAQYLALGEEIKALERRQEEVRQRIEMQMGAAERGEGINHVIKWGNRAGRTTLDTKALKADLPDIYGRYAKQGKPFRAFSITKKEA